MTLQWIPLDALEPHPENSNRMPAALLEKLKGHIRRTGLYEPLVVRPAPTDGDRPASGAANQDPHTSHAPPKRKFQILNGHHRAEALRQLGHTHARCDVWLVGDDDAWVLLATLNRLEGRDDPSARARLVSRLAEGPGGARRSPEDLARLLPEPQDAVERLLRLAEPPPAPLAPDAAAPLLKPMTFFLREEQHALVSEALKEVGKHCRMQIEECRIRDKGRCDPAPRSSRAETLERLAQWYLESRRLR